MKINYNPIANGAYVCGHRMILKDLGTWNKMTAEEKQFFRPCYKCERYAKYEANQNLPCPCFTCAEGKTEVQVDNQMKQLRRKYF